MHRDIEESILLSDMKFIRQKEYWTKKLSVHTHKTEFLYSDRFNDMDGKEREPRFQIEVKCLQIPIPAHLNPHLLKLSKNSDLSLYMVLLTVLKILIFRYGSSEDVIIASPLFIPRIAADTINDFVYIPNSIYNDSDSDNEETFIQLLLQVRQSVLDAYENQDYPTDTLIQQLRQEEVIKNDGILSNVVCLLQNIHGNHMTEQVGNRLLFLFERDESRVKGSILYDPHVYERNNPYCLEKIPLHFINVLACCLEDINGKISAICFLTTKEKWQLLKEFNDTTSGYNIYNKDKTICELFQEQVEKTPNHSAVVSGNQQLTYGELNGKANQLAGLLRVKGIIPGGIVGIMETASLEMIMAVLGVLKSGAAYLPLDPDLPRDRIMIMLNDSQAQVVLIKKKTVNNVSFTLLKGLNIIRLKPRITTPRARISQPDQLPRLDRSFICYEKYNRYLGYSMVKHSISLETTRGCPYNCTFCHKIFPRKQVARSAENLFAEVQFYASLGVRRFSIIDDIFNLDRKNSSRFFRLILKNRLNLHLFFTAGLRGDILTEEYMDLMMEAGTISLAPALETASPRLQKLTKKNLDIDRLRRNLEYICKKYPHINLELFTMHGFPTETEEEAMMTLDFIKQIKWIHFPYINILRIYSKTEMEKFAIANGISPQDIYKSEDMAYHQLPYTLKFDRGFTLTYQADFLNNYFLLKERLVNVLPHQMKILTREELIQKYDSYLPPEINSFESLLELAGIKKNEPGPEVFLDEQQVAVPDLDKSLKHWFPSQKPFTNALKILLLDLDLLFTHENDILYDLVDEPLGLLSLITSLNHRFGPAVNGKIAKSRIDFDSYRELRVLIENFQPDVIGIRILTFYRDFFHKTIAVIRQWGINAPIIAGGPHATTNYESVLQDSNVDLVVLGEGEVTFTEIIEKMIGNNGKLPGEQVLEKINGIAFIPAKEKQNQLLSRDFIFLDEDIQALTRTSRENPVPIHRLQDPAYVIYTSGSTGTPKGIIIQHRSLAAYVNAFFREFNLTSKDTVIQQASFSFDAFLEEVYPVLLRGGKIALPRRMEVMDIDLLYSFILRHNITLISCSPGLLDELNQRKIKTGIHTFISGGDVLNKNFIHHLLTCGKVYNTYGPTETTVCASYHRCSSRDKTSIPLGTPISNYSVYVLDKNNRLLPVGVVGQLCIAGPGVARGYLNRPGLTAERFIPDPFQGKSKKSRMYKSGDLVRWLPGGVLDFAGRIDTQVKIRGYRIETGEIENQLLHHERIKSVVVTLKKRGNETKDEVLCAYIVPNAGEMRGTSTADDPGFLAVHELREYLAERLPAYMIPAYFMPIKKIPITASGKIDRNALPHPGPTISGEKHMAPKTRLEEILAGIWAEILGIEKEIISITSNFFQLGGHSLKATILAAKIHKELNVKISLGEIFNLSTLQDLAAGIKKKTGVKFIPIVLGEKMEYYEVSQTQKRLWILNRFQEQMAAYNVPGACMFRGILNAKALKTAFASLIKRHDSLRTSFLEIKGEPHQKVHDFESLRSEVLIDHIDLEKEKHPGETAGRIVNQEAITPFDLEKAPLVKAKRLAIDEDKCVFLLVMHHIIADGWSMDVLIQEFLTLYNTYATEGNGKEKENPLPPLKIQYKDYAAWHNRQLRGDTLKKLEEYWTGQFNGEIPQLKLATDYPRPSVKTYNGACVPFVLDREISSGLEDINRTYGVSLFMTLLAALNVLFYCYTGQEDIIIGAPTAGREHSDLENQIGCYLNTLALRTRFCAQERFEALLNQVKEITLDTYEHQLYPFNLLVKEINVKPDPRRSPLFDVLMQVASFKTGTPGEMKMQGITVEPYDIELVHSKFDLTFNFTESSTEPGTIAAGLIYNVDLFKHDTIARMIGRFRELLKKIIKDTTVSLSDLSFEPVPEMSAIKRISRRKAGS